MELITSTQNKGIKEILSLSKARERREKGLFTIEGEREIRRANENQYEFAKILFCKNLMTHSSTDLLQNINCDQKIEVSENVFSRIAYRDSTDGLFAVCNSRIQGLEIFQEKDRALYLVIEKVEKPGNLGALLRTADAAGIDGIIVCDNHTDIYNPNVVRSSLGCLFTVKLAVCTSEECIAFLQDRNVRIYAAALQDSEIYTWVDMRESTAIVMGSEAAGLSEIWRKEADRVIAIPMNGDVDSLNVSVSAAILLYEAIRQRT